MHPAFFVHDVKVILSQLDSPVKLATGKLSLGQDVLGRIVVGLHLEMLAEEVMSPEGESVDNSQ